MARNGSQILLDALQANGVEYIFGIPGTLTLPVYDAMIDRAGATPIVTRHEQGAGFAADGYAKVSGKTGVVFTVPGPGGTNIATALRSAYEDAVPIVAVTTTLADNMRNRSAIHDVDMEKALAGCVKKALTPDSVAGIAPAVEAAFHWAVAGRPGPAQVVMKADLFQAEEERVIIGPEFEMPPPAPPVDERALDEIAESLLAARRPVIYAGNGVVSARCERQVQLLASRLSAPVVTSVKGRGILSEADPLSFGLVHFLGSEEMLEEADFCLALGTGFGQFATFYFKAPMPKNLVQIDIDPERIGRNYPASKGLVSDLNPALEGLLKRISNGEDVALSEGHVRVREGKRRYEERLRSFSTKPAEPPFHGLFVMKTLRQNTSPDTIFVSDSSATQSWLMEQAFVIYRPRSILLSEAYQSMGYALGAAIGAKLGAPDRPVCAVVGDGSFTMVCGELATATAFDLSITYIIFNDGEYNALRHSQKHVFGERYIATSLNNPDFPELARAFGAHGHRVESAKELGSLIRDSQAQGGVHAIDCPVDREVLSSRWTRTVKSFRGGAATAPPTDAATDPKFFRSRSTHQ